MIRPQDSASGGQPPIDPKSLFLQLELLLRKVTPGVVGEAQECFYDAMEAPTEEEEFRLLSRALELDPGNADAWLAMMRRTPLMSADEEIWALRKIVAGAEKRLGKKAFEEFTGHFWGFHETRPYMRARAALADALHRAGRIESAAAEVEAMLELNPGDNQGLRYRLLAFYLALKRMEDARRLLELHADEVGYNTVLAWSKVLELFLSGKPEEALKAVEIAEKQNGFSKAYLLGHRKIPKNLPDSYASGSKEEAACFSGDLQLAWNAHPEAKKWLAAMNPKKR
jgi:tetratricopeptide (TPR) repeat protein